MKSTYSPLKAASVYVVNHTPPTQGRTKARLRVEAAVQLSRPNHFVLIEVWQNQQAYDAHVGATHTKQFREKIQPMRGSPFDERLHQIIG